MGSDRAGEVKEDCHRNDVRDKAIILFFSLQTLVCAKGWQRAHLWLT